MNQSEHVKSAIHLLVNTNKVYICSFVILLKIVIVVIAKFVNSVPSRHHSIEKEPLKTSVTFLTDDKQEQTQGKFIPPYVTRYSTQGFRVQNTKVFGSVAILPEVFYHWKVNVLIIIYLLKYKMLYLLYSS